MGHVRSRRSSNAIPRYHFRVLDGRPEADAGSLVLPDLRAAKVEAQRFAGEIIRDAADRADGHGMLRVEVTDEDNALLFHMQFVTSMAATELLRD